MGRVEGLEPSAFWATTRRSNRLSYTLRRDGLPAWAIQKYYRVLWTKVKLLVGWLVFALPWRALRLGGRRRTP